jgi:hypothetical protein
MLSVSNNDDSIKNVSTALTPENKIIANGLLNPSSIEFALIVNEDQKEIA